MLLHVCAGLDRIVWVRRVSVGFNFFPPPGYAEVDSIHMSLSIKILILNIALLRTRGFFVDLVHMLKLILALMFAFLLISFLGFMYLTCKPEELGVALIKVLAFLRHRHAHSSVTLQHLLLYSGTLCHVTLLSRYLL
jgi:hypothetical protein